MIRLGTISFVFLGLILAGFHLQHSYHRSEAGQVAFLRDEFRLTSCDAVEVLTASFQGAGTDFSNRTDFKAGEICVFELLAQAEKQGFDEREPGWFLTKRENGYREQLLLTSRNRFTWLREQI